MSDYVKYGDEWRKEVMKNKKNVIIDMLRRVAFERDSLEAAQPSAQRTDCTCGAHMIGLIPDDEPCPIHGIPSR